MTSSDNDEDGKDPTFEDLFGELSDDDDDEKEVVVHCDHLSVVVRTEVVVKSKKATAKRVRAWREAERKRQIEYENTVFSQACKRLAAQRRDARTVRITPEVELRDTTHSLVRAMTLASELDDGALRSKEPAIYKVKTLKSFKQTLAKGGVQLRAYLSNQPAFFSAVRLCLTP